MSNSGDYWSQYDGKAVSLKSLLKWLSDKHDHVTDEEGEPFGKWNFPVVNSMALHRWAIEEAKEADEVRLTEDYLMAHEAVTRVELIEDSGRAYVKYGATDVVTSIQDQGRTLKIFLRNS